MIPDLAEILDTAADMIEKYGWQQKVYGNYDEGFCAVGAIGAAITSRGWHSPRVTAQAITALNRHLKMFYVPFGGKTISTAWNDEPERTKYEVIDQLRLAAKDLRNNGIYR